MHPYCFVITSYGSKPDIQDVVRQSKEKEPQPVKNINFKKIYTDLIEPAIRKAELEPIMENEEANFGVIHKTMYEKIILSEFCVTDLTNMNPNVYYELGMRYAVKPCTTIPIIASSHFPLPFDIGPNRTWTYQVDGDFNLTNKDNDIASLAEILRTTKEKRSTDSPLYDLVNGISFQNSVAHEKTDIFRDKVIYDEKIKEELAIARSFKNEQGKIDAARCVAEIKKIIDKHGDLKNAETGVLIDMMLSLRNVSAFPEMQEFIERLPGYVFESVMVQEQYAFALNRNGSKVKPPNDVLIEKAEKVLTKLEADKKASSETYGIWGRIHKDKFDRAYEAKDRDQATYHLKNAMNYYRQGFEFDCRDAYPGVNYVTCLHLLGKNKLALRLLPAVEFAVQTKMKRKEVDYWDKATLLELAVIENEFKKAKKLVGESRALANEEWMTGTTVNNLAKIIWFRKKRGDETKPIKKIIALLTK